MKGNFSFFFPSFIRVEKKRSLSSKIHRTKRGKKREKGRHKTHTHRERHGEKEVRACVKESVRDAKNEDSLENAVRILLLHHVLVFFFSFFSPTEQKSAFFSFCGFLLSLLSRC